MTTVPGPNVFLVLVDHDLRIPVVVSSLRGRTDLSSALCCIRNPYLHHSRGFGPYRSALLCPQEKTQA